MSRGHSRVGAIHETRGIETWRGHSRVEEAFKCDMMNLDTHGATCGGDIQSTGDITIVGQNYDF